MIWACLSRYRRPQRGPAAAMMAARARQSKACRDAPRGIAKLRQKSSLGVPAGGIGPTMKIPRLGSMVRAACALGAVSLGAAALAGGQSFLPGEALTALRSLIPSETLVFQLLLIGWIGVALGRFTVATEPSPARRGGQTGLPSGDGGEGRESRPDPEPDRQGASDPSRPTARAFPSGSTAPTSGCRGRKASVRSRTSCWPSSTTIATCATSFPTSGPARRIAPPGRATANEPRAGRGGRTARRRDRDRQSPLL